MLKGGILALVWGGGGLNIVLGLQRLLVDDLLCGRSGHGRLPLGPLGFHALLRGGILAFKRDAGGLSSDLSPKKSTVNLGVGGGGLRQEGYEARSPLKNRHRAPKLST